MAGPLWWKKFSEGRYEETGPTHGGFRFFDDMYADVKVEGKLLALHPSWDPEKVLLYPEKKDLFFSMTIPGPFIFLRDPNNRIMGMFNRGTQLKKEP